MFLKESTFLCPVCKSKLFALPSQLKCLKGHSFDIAKQGYVNLLLDNTQNKRHGDDKLMVRSRRDFLEKGFYKELLDGICHAVKTNISENGVIADIGCGEGYYTSAVLNCGNFNVFGIDISKDALKYAAKSLKNAQFAVASAFSLPFSDKSVDCVLNVFAPIANEEYLRVLKPNGIFVCAVALENHLLSLHFRA